MAKETRKVPLYGVHFKGIFGRNRSVKFKANRDLVERPAGEVEVDFVTRIANAFAASIGPKDGLLRVVVYKEGEVTRYTGEDGIDGRDYTTYLYQPYDAQELLRRGYEGKVAAADVLAL